MLTGPIRPLGDLGAIEAYISRDSVYYAKRFVDRIVRTTATLKKFPERGNVVPELSDRTIRECVLHNYRILYQIQEARALIVAVVHAARNIESLRLDG